MKRLAVIAMAVVMLVCALALPASALTANGYLGDAKVPLYKGAITVDGKVDEAYKLGLKLDFNKSHNDKFKTETTAVAYLLHDAKYLYVVFDVKSAYPLAEYNPKYDGENSWNTTCLEISFDWNNDGADGYKYYGRIDNKIIGVKDSKAEFVTYASKVNGQNYVLEMKFEMQEGATTGKEVGLGTFLNSDKTMGKDKTATRSIAAVVEAYSTNDAKLFKNIVLDSKEVKLAAATTAATTKAPAAKPTAPATFDAGIILAVAAAAAGAGVVVSKKRK